MQNFHCEVLIFISLQATHLKNVPLTVRLQGVMKDRIFIFKCLPARIEHKWDVIRCICLEIFWKGTEQSTKHSRYGYGGRSYICNGYDGTALIHLVQWTHGRKNWTWMCLTFGHLGARRLLQAPILKRRLGLKMLLFQPNPRHHLAHHRRNFLHGLKFSHKIHLHSHQNLTKTLTMMKMSMSMPTSTPGMHQPSLNSLLAAHTAGSIHHHRFPPQQPQGSFSLPSHRSLLRFITLQTEIEIR